MRPSHLAVGLALLALAACDSGFHRPPDGARGDTTASVQFTHDPNGACAKAGANTHVTGCGGKGWAILPNPCDWPNRPGDYGDLACHELGRIWGWVAP